MKKVKFIGGRIYDHFNQPFGGTPMTIHCYLRAFENSTDYKIVPVERTAFDQEFANRLDAFRKDADIFHVDDTSVLSRMYANRMDPPDVIGPIARSPVKNYKGWACPYPKEWFYKANVIRLNYSEEYNKKIDYRDHVTLIRHGVDTEYLQPHYAREKKYVLWAGDKKRFAKNHDLFAEIVGKTTLPYPFKWKVLNFYNVADYWKILDETALLVNTSRYESFCCALFEAKAKGVPTIYKKGLHGPEVHEESPGQIDYDSDSYKKAIETFLGQTDLALLAQKWKRTSQIEREYCEQEASLELMYEDIADVYAEV